MPNLVQTLGREFFNDRVGGCLLPHEGRVLKVIGVTREGQVEAHVASRAVPQVDSPIMPLSTQVVRLDADVFSSYDVLQAPVMGYRRCGVYSFRARRDQRASHAPGFHVGSFVGDWSHSARYVMETVRGAQQYDSTFMLHSMYFPEYDGPGALRQLLNAEKLCVVLDENVLIEPNCRTPADYYDVWVRGLLLGHITPEGGVHQNTPAENRHIIERIISNGS